jgi:hypothetical protein
MVIRYRGSHNLISLSDDDDEEESDEDEPAQF